MIHKMTHEEWAKWADRMNAEHELRIQAAALDLLDAAKSAYYALVNIAAEFKYVEGDAEWNTCPFEELCGEPECDRSGCIRDKRDELRAAIEKAEGR